MEGAFDAFNGKEVDLTFEAPKGGSGIIKVSKETEEEIKFGYCTEFIIVLNNPISEAEEHSLRNSLPLLVILLYLWQMMRSSRFMYIRMNQVLQLRKL